MVWPLSASLGWACSGVLSVAVAQGSAPYCGKGFGCLVAEEDPWSKLMGIPIAWIALVYFSITILACIVSISRNHGPQTREVVFSLFAFLVTCAYVYRSFVLRSLCWWCAGIWVATALMLACTLLLANEKCSLTQTGRLMTLTGAFTIVLSVGYFSSFQHPNAYLGEIDQAKLSMLRRDELFQILGLVGDKHLSNEYLIAVLDFQCPHCRSVYPRLRDFCKIRSNPTLAIWILPLEGHDLGRMYGAGATVALKKDRFEEFADNAFSKELSLTQLKRSLRSIPTTNAEFESITRTLSGPAYSKLDAMISEARKLGLNRTPTYLWLSEKEPCIVLNPAKVDWWLRHGKARQRV